MRKISSWPILIFSTPSWHVAKTECLSSCFSQGKRYLPYLGFIFPSVYYLVQGNWCVGVRTYPRSEFLWTPEVNLTGLALINKHSSICSNVLLCFDFQLLFRKTQKCKVILRTLFRVTPESWLTVNNSFVQQKYHFTQIWTWNTANKCFWEFKPQTVELFTVKYLLGSIRTFTNWLY